LTADKAPGHSFSVDLDWMAPAYTAGEPIGHYTIVTQQPAGMRTVSTRSVTLTGLSAGIYIADVYATTTTGVTSAPASVMFTILPTGSFAGNPGLWSASEAPLPARRVFPQRRGLRGLRILCRRRGLHEPEG
jgi:hypothetical protein